MSLLNSSDTQFFFDVIDGWGGNLDSGGVISDSIQPAAVHRNAPSGTTPLKRGAIVVSSHDGTNPTVEIPLVDANVNLDADKRRPKLFWMVVEGNTAYDYSALLGKNKVVCLRGDFTVETAHVNGSLSIGAAVTVEHGTNSTVVEGLLPHQSTAGGSPGVNQGRFAALAAGDPKLGTIIDKKTVDGVDVYTIECSF